MLRRTIVGAALQQQSTFLQVAELPHADEVVVHSRNFPLSGLPSGACQTVTQCKTEWNNPPPPEKQKNERNEPLTNTLGGAGSDTVFSMAPTGIRFKSKYRTQGCICVYIMNSQQSWDHRATNSLLKYENGRRKKKKKHTHAAVTAAQLSEYRASVTDANDNEQDLNCRLLLRLLCLFPLRMKLKALWMQ